ncbi:hypothetical protein [Streptomyces sp. C1-2]|uniref:hypothetical protein n=1 Tax=Streptomyces sp. C1-2 TaxID=2720022 RepID=UPI0014326588|nr:hypothetical protein [Streptomyces sp. C1-2]NJP74559.1 hypothetical protein [Streptomyces sp. C1-2]
MPEPVTPSRIIPAGQPLPGPPAVPPPPVPPVPPDAWWHLPPSPPPPPPSPPPVPVPEVVVHTTIHLPAPDEPAPAPGVRWWQTFRPGYNLLCAAAGTPLTAWWAGVLGDARTQAGLAGAWVIALVPLGLVALVDNVVSVAAVNSAPGLWLPRLRAAACRTVLWALLIGTAVALPVMTLVYVVTGVRS